MSHDSYTHGATIKAGSSVLQSTFFVSNLIILSFSMPLQLVYSCTRVFFNTVLCIDMNSTLSTSFSIIIGVIILVELIDERFREERNRAFISKWLRRPLRVYENFDLSLEGLKSFFENAKEHYGINTVRATQSLGLNGDVVQNKDQNAWFTRKKKQKLNKSGNGDGRETSVIENNISFPTLTSPDLIESQPSAQKNSNTYNCKYLPQCSNQTEPR
ncbi:hypothetical protein GLYMA_17G262000v4 [Glycine max]|nr:hypothetical protein GLYMA_17G262000v4 [Glycine max]KAH1120247.1 hypothetical protein GYH30_048538 [Glycine max]